MTSINTIYSKKSFYDLGEFVAKAMLAGKIHPDIQMSNIGYDDGKFSFIDFADMEEFAIPEDLSDFTLRKLTQSLFSAVNNFMDFPDALTYFHAGFVAYGGLLGQCLFFNMTNQDFSIQGYLGMSHTPLSFDPSFLYKYNKNKDSIKEWKNSPLKKISISNYDLLEKYGQSKEREYISTSNLYYMDYLYYSRCYIGLEQSNQDIADSDSKLIMNMGWCALRAKFYYIAHGLLLKCLSLPNIHTKTIFLCNMGLYIISNSIHLNTYITDIISDNLNLDLFCLLWLLGELEHCKLAENE